MAIDLGRIHKGMHVRTSDGADLGKVAEVWLGTDPRSATSRCDEEVCSRLQVHRGLLRRRVLFVPYNAVASVSGKGVTLGVDGATARSKNWSARPKWVPGGDFNPAAFRSGGGGGGDPGG